MGSSMNISPPRRGNHTKSERLGVPGHGRGLRHQPGRRGGSVVEELGKGSGLVFEPSGGGWGYVGDVFDGGGVDLVEGFGGSGVGVGVCTGWGG